jgi:hypothetical protein
MAEFFFAPFATVSLSLDLLGRAHDREKRGARLNSLCAVRDGLAVARSARARA